MAKKKSPKPPPAARPAGSLAGLGDLKADPKNPRRISERAKAKLRGSLEKFGDLSGIVFNRRTGELVTGHQRAAQIRRLWPDAELVMAPAGAGGDGSEGRGMIVVDDDHCFLVRVVDWSPAMQRAANVTANNPKIQGEFTDDVRAYLVDVHEALDAELPAIAQRVRLLEWLVEEADCGDQPLESVFQVIVICDGEDQQIKLHAELARRGLKATAVVG